MNANLKFYWILFLRRLPFLLIPILICSAIGVVTAIKTPPTYSASARLLVEAPQIPDSMINSSVSTAAAEQLEIIEQRLLTRANLIDISNKLKVFSPESTLNPDQVLALMKANTRIWRSSGRNQATLMTLSFQARTGQIAANVINDYVTLILEESTDFRMSRAENTLSFFEQEKARLGRDLDVQSDQIIQFKTGNKGALPDDLEYRLGRQALLQDRISQMERERAGIQSQRSDMVAIFQATGRISAAPQALLSNEERQLQVVEGELQQARSVYSATNPRIRLLETRKRNLEEVIQERAGATQVDGDATVAPASLLDITLAELDSRLAAIDQEVDNSNAELVQLAASIDKTSSNSIALAALERDYENIQAQYNNAVANLNQARMGERIEVSAKGERITVIEGASVPRQPSGPNRPVIAAAGMGFGLALAAGLFTLLELMNRTIRRPLEIQNRFDLTPIATIPYIETGQERLRRHSMRLAAMVAVLILIPTVLWYIDTNHMPLDILANKVINRLRAL